MRAIPLDSRMTRCNALPNIDTGCESEIIPYLLVPVILFCNEAEGFNDANALELSLIHI